MAEQVEANNFSPMMLFAATMQMVHMEREIQDAATDAEKKEAYTEIIKGRVSSHIVKVFVQQCFQNAHPEQAAAEEHEKTSEGQKKSKVGDYPVDNEKDTVG